MEQTGCAAAHLLVVALPALFGAHLLTTVAAWPLSAPSARLALRVGYSATFCGCGASIGVMASFLACQIGPEVVTAARRGERPAQEAIYREYSCAVYTLAMRIVGHREAAEEVLQDTFIEVLRKLDSFRGDAPLGAWIRRIAVNKSLMFLRSGWRRYARPLEVAAEPRAELAHQDEVGLEHAMAQLSATARAVVWLHDVEGYTHDEIGNMMGKTQSFSKSQLSRAHRRLRELLTPQTGEMSCMQALNNC